MGAGSADAAPKLAMVSVATARNQVPVFKGNLRNGVMDDTAVEGPHVRCNGIAASAINTVAEMDCVQRFVRNRSWSAMPTSIVTTKAAAAMEPLEAETMAGPGQ